MGMTGAERQARYRAKQGARVKELEAAATASRNGADTAFDLEHWMNAEPVEDIATTLVNAVTRPARMEQIIVAMADLYRSRHVTVPSRARTKTYTCEVEGCGTFEAPVQPGRPPKRCPAHRNVTARRKAQANG